MGEYKWQQLGLQYKLSHTASPTREKIEEVKTIFRKYELNVE